MYYYGGGVGCGQNQSAPYYCPCSKSNHSNNYAIVLVLFILLVIIIGCRWAN